MIIAVGAVVASLLVALGITGFVAPGFLRTDRGTPALSTQTGSSGPDLLIHKLVTATDDRDRAAMRDLACAEAGPNVQQAIADVGATEGAALTDRPAASGGKVSATLAISFAGSARQFEVEGVRNSNGWCWQDISNSGSAPAEAGTPPPTARIGEGKDFAKKFLGTLNAGDAAGAKRLLCQDSDAAADIGTLVSGNVRLQIDTTEVEETPSYLGADLKGTLDGKPVSAARISAFRQDQGWCAYTIFAF